MTDARDLAVNIITIEEGFRENPYLCSEGFPTVGIGFRCDSLESPSMTPEDAQERLLVLVDEVIGVLEKSSLGDVWELCSPLRRAVLISSCFQLGFRGISAFKGMFRALRQEDYPQAAIEMRDSRWYRQTPNRVGRQSEMLEHDELLDYYK